MKNVLLMILAAFLICLTTSLTNIFIQTVPKFRYHVETYIPKDYNKKYYRTIENSYIQKLYF
jgi:hypothetical protein